MHLAASHYTYRAIPASTPTKNETKYVIAYTDYNIITDSDYSFGRPGFDSRLYQIFLELVGLKRGPQSLVKVTDE
jgi:hypothetical protein